MINRPAGTSMQFWVKPALDNTAFMCNIDVAKRIQLRASVPKGTPMRNRVCLRRSRRPETLALIPLPLEPLEVRLLLSAPSLLAGVQLRADGQTIAVDGGDSVPYVVDWTNDGKKDLLVGQFTDGNVHLFNNIGTGSNPVLTSSGLIQSSGSPITTTYG